MFKVAPGDLVRRTNLFYDQHDLKPPLERSTFVVRSLFLSNLGQGEVLITTGNHTLFSKWVERVSDV